MLRGVEGGGEEEEEGERQRDGREGGGERRRGGPGIYFQFLYAAAVVLVTSPCKSERCLPANRPGKESSDFLSRHLTPRLSLETSLFTQPAGATLTAKKIKKKKKCDVFLPRVVTKWHRNVRDWHTAQTYLTVA